MYMHILLAAAAAFVIAAPVSAQVLDKQKLLDAQTFWDNRDWNWYKDNIPFFECPDADITTTYYYRWELVTKHLTYGSPQSGYSFTEFIDRPFWSGTYGAIVAQRGISSTKSAGCAIHDSPGIMPTTGFALPAPSLDAIAAGLPTPFGPCSASIRMPHSSRLSCRTW